MPSGAPSVCFTKKVWRVFVGQENGTVSVIFLNYFLNIEVPHI
jgi:hypothetical protein